MREALDDVASAKGSRLAELRDVLCGFVAPGFRELQPMTFPWLNASQQRAVNKTLCCRDVMVVHGPPGTGKTTTLVEAVYETLRREPQVMVCAQSNAAVDWICGKLIDRGVPVLRVGNPARVDDKVLSATYERQFEAIPTILSCGECARLSVRCRLEEGACRALTPRRCPTVCTIFAVGRWSLR